MKEKILSIQQLYGYSHALVEAGHFYANETIATIHETGIKTGLTVVKILKEVGLQVTPCILIDDYNAPDLASEQNLNCLKESGFDPEVIYREKDLTDKAQEVLALLGEAGKIKTKNGATYLKQGFKLLVDQGGKFSCSLLDSALYLKKHQTFGGICVTVLPESFPYPIQQQTTKSILKEANLSIPILNVFYQENGQISLNFDF